jgi:hypothetical protein
MFEYFGVKYLFLNTLARIGGGGEGGGGAKNASQEGYYPDSKRETKKKCAVFKRFRRN